MKILYINSPHFDYMQDILYSGLVKESGAKNIKSIPFNFNFCCSTKKYPRNLGAVKGNAIPYIASRLMPFRYDCVILASAKRQVFEVYNKIAGKIPAHIPVAFVDGGDMENVGGDAERKGFKELYDEARAKRDFDFIFKREMIIGKQYDKNVLPLPFGFNFDRIPGKVVREKAYDVSFWAVESHEVRTKALKILEDKYDCKANGTERNQRFKHYKRKGEFYLEELQACKIVLNFRGGGWDTLRYWEVPALKTFLLSQKPQIVIPDDFTHGENIVYCKDDLSDLTELIDYYLSHDDERERVALAAYDHLKRYHSDRERAKYVIKHICG